MASWLDLFQSAALARIQQSTERTELSLLSLHTKVNTLMAQVQVAQEDLDALDGALDQVTADLTAHIDALVAAAEAGEPLPAANLDALKADVEALAALSAPNPQPPE